MRLHEQVDAVVPGRLEAVLHDIALLGAAICEPATEGPDRDLETRGSQMSEDHCANISECSSGKTGIVAYCSSGRTC